MGSKSASLAAAFGALALTAMAGQAQAQNAPPQNQWFKVCTKQADNDICNVQNVRTAQTGQLLTAVNLIQITGKQNRALFQIAVPTGRVIPAGIGMQIDDGETRRIPYSICLPDRCIAETPLTEELVASLKAGGGMTLTTVNFQNQPNPIEVTLQGFTAAFDGDPIQQSEVEERQQQLQAEIERLRQAFVDGDERAARLRRAPPAAARQLAPRRQFGGEGQPALAAQRPGALGQVSRQLDQGVVGTDRDLAEVAAAQTALVGQRPDNGTRAHVLALAHVQTVGVKVPAVVEAAPAAAVGGACVGAVIAQGAAGCGIRIRDRGLAVLGREGVGVGGVEGLPSALDAVALRAAHGVRDLGGVDVLDQGLQAQERQDPAPDLRPQGRAAGKQ